MLAFRSFTRNGFVHEFRRLSASEIRQQLERHWTPPGVGLPGEAIDSVAAASIIRITGGNFRLLNRLLTQVEWILEINSPPTVTKDVVEAARENLVIEQSQIPLHCAVDREFRWIAGATQRALSLPLQYRHPCAILNHMVQYNQDHFDTSFGALSDATRRGVLEQLGRADASITALAERFHMTLTGMKKHVGVLEKAGLVSTEKVGRVRTCKLGLRRLEEEAAWIERYRQLWAARFDALDIVVEELKRKEEANGR